MYRVTGLHSKADTAHFAYGHATDRVVGNSTCCTWFTCLMLGVFHQEKNKNKNKKCSESKIHKPVSIHQVHIWWIHWIWTILLLTYTHNLLWDNLNPVNFRISFNEKHIWKRYSRKFRLELDLHTNWSFIHELKGQATCRTMIWPSFSM